MNFFGQMIGCLYYVYLLNIHFVKYDLVWVNQIETLCTHPVRVQIVVIYLFIKVQEHDFPEGQEPMLHLIYRPGHYDILYPKL